MRILHDVMRALADDCLETLPRPPFDRGDDRECCLSSARRRREGVPPRHLESRQLGCTGVRKVHGESWRFRNGTMKRNARLLRNCKANGTTVHGAICAAATRHPPASDAYIIRMHCPVDLSRITKIETTGRGLFIGAGIVEIPAVGRELWRTPLYRRDLADGAVARGGGWECCNKSRLRCHQPQSKTPARGNFFFFAAKLRSYFEFKVSCRLRLNMGH